MRAHLAQLTTRPNPTAPRRLPSLAPLKRLIDAFREANAERALRQAWAQLDPSVLRDLGIGADEIPRVRAAEDFTPRNWIG